MRRILIPLLLVLLVPALCQTQQTDGVTVLPGMVIDTALSGTWTSMIDPGNRTATHRMIVRIQAMLEGTCFATMDLPDNLTYSVPIPMMSCSGHNIDMASETLNLTFTGRYSPAERRIDGTLTIDGRTSAMRLEKSASVTLPRPTSLYPEQTLRVRNESGGVAFTAICTMPDTNRPWPVVIIISDDGPDDADGSFASFRPFRDLATSFANQQWATVRFADRGVQGSTGQERTASISDRASDVLALLKRLRTFDRIDTTRIVLLGFGEGGLVASAVAASSTLVDGVVLLHTPSMDGYSALLERIRATSPTPADASTATELVGSWMNYLASIKELPALVEAIRRSAANARTSNPALGSILTGFQRANAADYTAQTIIPWLQSLRDLSPGPFLRDARGPILALYADRSHVWPLQRTADTMRELLRDNPQSDVHILSGYNRRFQRCAECTVEEESYLPASIDTMLVDIILGWAVELADVKAKR